MFMNSALMKAGDRIRTGDVQLGKAACRAQIMVEQGLMASFWAENEVRKWIVGH